MSNEVDVPTWWDGTVRTWSSRPLAAVPQVALECPENLEMAGCPGARENSAPPGEDGLKNITATG
jgi:hypothetical protein